MISIDRTFFASTTRSSSVSFIEQVSFMTEVLRKPDRRILRTRQLLRDALLALITDKGYQNITVQDVTDRANVARTTFYLHYKDIDDLLFSSMADMYQDLFDRWLARGPLNWTEDGFPSSNGTEDFEHVALYASFYRVMMSENGSMKFLVRVQQYLTQAMEATLQQCMPVGHTPSMPLPMLAAILAGIEIGVMMWWIQNDMPYTPEAMARLCDRFSGPGVMAVLGLEQKTS
jgi:AcrR family transcriptional regulator